MFGPVYVEGLAGLQRAFAKVSTETRRGLRDQLKVAAEPARARAEKYTLGGIRNMTRPWARMRIGVTTQAVYVAPVSRRRGGPPRPNLAPLMFDEMEVGVEDSMPEIETGMEAWLGVVGRGAGF